MNSSNTTARTTAGSKTKRLPGVVAAVQRRARADYFVGRGAELDTFAQVLAEGDSPRIVYVYGPAGIGKSSLLDAYRAVAEKAGCGFARLDARQLATVPRAVEEAATGALAVLPRAGGLHVLVLDHFERLAALDGWLRNQLLPELPENIILVLAARTHPTVIWRADPGIAQLLTEVALEPLTASEASDYLQRRGVKPDQAQAVQGFARGYPLPLALAADQVLREPEKTFEVDRFPDLIRALVRWLLHEVDSPDALLALQACASVRRLNEPLLAAMLARADVSAQFDWLADQHYVESQTGGLVIHDLVREIVINDLRTRNLERHHTLVRRSIDYLMGDADTAQMRFQRSTVPDMIFTLRHEEHIRNQFGFGEFRCYPDTAQPDEIEALAAEVERLEGGESSAWFMHWVQDQGSELVVMRDSSQVPVAFALLMCVHAADMAVEQNDPCLQSLFTHLRAHAPLRGDEQVLLVRFQMAHGTHQSPTPAWAELFSHLNGRMFTPGISLYALVADLAYQWAEMADNAEYHLLADSQYRIGTHDYKISAHDMRSEPALAWARNSAERVLRGGNAPELKPPPVNVMDKPAFAAAVRECLRHYRDDQAMAQTPLLQAPLLRWHAEERDLASLRALVERTSSQELGNRHLLLDLAYFQENPTKQSAIASELHISERTLRRRLRDAQEQLIEALWQLDTTP